jgi:hypothetical protein
MPELRNIPLTYKEGIYSITDFNKDIDSENAISFDYDTQYQILTYTIPIDERLLTLYSVSEDELIRTLRAVYNKEGTLSKVTATLNAHETLLYIYYKDSEHARQEIYKFAIRNADAIIEQIQQCTDALARLFIEYYSDSENMDYHAKIATAAQVELIKQKYHSKDSCDHAGNYSSENIEGDNHMLITMVRCADAYPVETFQYAVEIMSKHIEEALVTLNKTEDFKYICAEYD